MKHFLMIWVFVLAVANVGFADTFGSGANQFDIDFVTISGATNPASGYGIVNNDYRIGIHEITNDQWNKFVTIVGGTVIGIPLDAYDESPLYTGADVPTNRVSWLEAAQFVNWLNTSNSHQAAYKFTGDPGTSSYALDTWSVAEADNGTNLYRHKDAFYFLPTEDEWVKAAYWNGTTLQEYATKPGETLYQGNGSNGGWNYDDGDNPAGPGPWDVDSGSEELNGTYDMMGNVAEWMESPWSDTNYCPGSDRCIRGGSYFYYSFIHLGSSARNGGYPDSEIDHVGFRVASVPEPCSIVLLLSGGLVLLRKRVDKRGQEPFLAE